MRTEYWDHRDPSFTLAGYRELLRRSQARWPPASFHEYDSSDRFLLWRHDVDFSVSAALRMAHLEEEEEVQATYFFLLRGDFYNAGSRSNTRRIREIASGGHWIGLHFDLSQYDSPGKGDFELHLSRERDQLEQISGSSVRTFSFHNPTDAALRLRAPQYGGMINAYASTLTDGLTYVSDSNGYWRHRSLGDVFNDEKSPQIQVLIHPTWWQEVPLAPRERIHREVWDEAAGTVKRYDDLLDRDTRENRRGPPGSLESLRPWAPAMAIALDGHWNRGDLQALFAELLFLRRRLLFVGATSELERTTSFPVTAEDLALAMEIVIADHEPESIYQAVLQGGGPPLGSGQFVQQLIATENNLRAGAAMPPDQLEHVCLRLTEWFASYFAWAAESEHSSLEATQVRSALASRSDRPQETAKNVLAQTLAEHLRGLTAGKPPTSS